MREDAIAFDINLGCSAYPYGIWLASKIIDGIAIKKVLLLVGDTISKFIDVRDRSTSMLFGDAGSATMVEFSEHNERNMSFIFGSDGSGWNNLILPKSTKDDNPLLNDKRVIGKDPTKLFMDGSSIFMFTLKVVPPMVKRLIERSDSEIDFYLFHQANIFILDHLVKKIGLDLDKVPSNIEKYGNTSSTSIPLLLTDANNYEMKKLKNIAMFGFGVGYSWAGALISFESNTYFGHIEQE